MNALVMFGRDPLISVKRLAVLVQGGGLWKAKTSGWPGSLRPT